MSQSPKSSLVGSVFERKPSASPSIPSAPRSNANGGFPSVQHRSKSAFQRARQDQKKVGGSDRPTRAPSVVSASSSKLAEDGGPDEHPGSRAIAEATEDWRRQMEEDNRRRVEAMTEDEREAERREILEKFGPNVGEILRKARAARETAYLKDTSGDDRTSRPRADSKLLKSAS